MSQLQPPAEDAYADEAISIRALAARAKSADARAQLLHIAVLYEKLSVLMRHAALNSLVRIASTLREDLLPDEVAPRCATDDQGGSIKASVRKFPIRRASLDP